MKRKLTKEIVDGTQPQPRDYIVFDTKLTGFGLKVTPKGAKIYLLEYRLGGKKRRYTIGRHGAPWTVDEARREALKLLGQVADRIDPARAKAQQQKREITISELADRYLTDHVELKNKDSTGRGFRRLVSCHIKPSMGTLTVAEITRADVAHLHHGMRDTPRQANQTLAVLSKMLNLAEAWGFRPDGTNPCRHVQRYREVARSRFLSDTELGRLGKTLAEIESDGREMASVFAAVRLAVLTGCRVGELLALRWDDTDLHSSALIIRDGKAGGRLHSVGALTLAYLAELQGNTESPWVLPGATGVKPLSIWTLESAWARIRKRANLEDVRLHDMRHTVATYAGQTGANAFLIRDKLGHKTLAMTSRYVNRDHNPLRILSDKVESRVVSAMKSGANPPAAAA